MGQYSSPLPLPLLPPQFRLYSGVYLDRHVKLGKVKRQKSYCSQCLYCYRNFTLPPPPVFLLRFAVAPEATASNLELYKEPIPAILTFRLIGSSRGVTRFLHNLAVAGSRVSQKTSIRPYQLLQAKCLFRAFQKHSSCKYRMNCYRPNFTEVSNVE
jgi:hypothetical protein